MFDEEESDGLVGLAAERDRGLVDTLDDAGNVMGRRQAGDVHVKGFWHRYVHVWVLDLENRAVMLQLRAPGKKPYGSMWSCCTGLVGEAEPAQCAAARALQEELKLSHPEEELVFLFACRENTTAGDYVVKQNINAYVLPLGRWPKVAPDPKTLGVDADQATAIKYMSLDSLEAVFAEKPPDYVVVENPEYVQRLFHSLRKIVREYHENLPRDDSDDETTNWKARQLLDTLDARGTVQSPGQRGAVHKESVWHRAVHVWILDLTQSAVLLLQRAARKQHFGACWHCCSGYVQTGDPALPAAVASVQDDLGLVRFSESAFEFLFQARTETDTGGGCLLKQIVDVYCVTVPSQDYEQAPSKASMVLSRSEVDDVRYMDVDELEAVWARGKQVHPDYVMPCSGEYAERLFFLLKRKCHKYQLEVAGGTWPPWSTKGAASTGGLALGAAAS